MSFVISSENQPFSIVAENPTVGQLDSAIQAGIASAQFLNAAPNDLITNPGQTVIVGGGNDVQVSNFTDTPASILVTGQGTRLDFEGPANIQITNLGGAGVIAENIDPSGDGATQTVDISASYADVNVNVIQDTSELVAGNTGSELATIEEVGSKFTADINFYVHTGSGDDLVIGSSINDFIRAGAGDDQIDSRGGDDLVRAGAGADTICLGAGSDTLLYTVDQLDGAEDVILDYDSEGNEFDKIVVDTAGGQGTAELLDENTVQIVVDGESVKITSEADFIDPLDIEFI